jgi:hypothetical protein
MSNENRLIEQRGRGQRADAILNDPMVQEAFVEIERILHNTWQNSDVADHEGRHNAYLSAKLLKRFKQYFENHIKKGKAADKELLRIKERSKLRKVINA